MINEINTELFVELSDEQQQLVAGGNGGSPIAFDDLIKNKFVDKLSAVDSKVVQTVDGHGSSTYQDTSIANQETVSEALKKFGIKV